MKCPSCGMENSETQIYCTSCGSALYGPRSVNLTDNNKSNNINDIRSITGIDINSLPIGQTYVSSGKREKVEKPKHHSSLGISTILFVIVILVLSVLCGYFYLENRKLSSGTVECPKTEKCVCENNIEGIYGSTSKMAFYLPSNYRYTESGSETIISDGQISINIYGIKNGQIDRVSSEAIKAVYNEDSYSNVYTSDEVLAKRKIVYAAFTVNEVYFTDFYYQYDSEKYLYGQISSSSAVNVVTEDVKNILASIVIEDKKSFQAAKAPVSYDKIFSLLK